MVMLAENQAWNWLQGSRQVCEMRVSEIPWGKSKEWEYNRRHIQHKSKGFFRVIGSTVCFNGKRQNRLDQPLIDQPEIGILGFLVRRIGERTEILLQAKAEPGNIGLVQAAPSVQATRSNYKRLHQGKKTFFLEYFLEPRSSVVLADSLQSEQGTRFLSKFNRNMIVEVPETVSIPENQTFNWVPMGEFLQLLNRDFQVNTDARSVLTCGPWRSLANNSRPFARWRDQGGIGEALLRSYEAPEEKSECSTAEIIERLNRLRSAVQFEVAVLGIPELARWEMTDCAIRSTDGTALEVRQYSIESSAREVNCWDQPLMASRDRGHAILLCQEKGGVLHFLFNGRAEIGFRQRFEYGPTIQDPDGDTFILPEQQEKENELRILLENAKVLASNLQSDEGGRFFRCISRYSICLLDKDEEIRLDRSLSWFTLRQIEAAAKRPSIFSNEARSLISMLLPLL